MFKCLWDEKKALRKNEVNSAWNWIKGNYNSVTGKINKLSRINQQNWITIEKWTLKIAKVFPISFFFLLSSASLQTHRRATTRRAQFDTNLIYHLHIRESGRGKVWPTPSGKFLLLIKLLFSLTVCRRRNRRLQFHRSWNAWVVSINIW